MLKLLIFVAAVFILYKLLTGDRRDKKVKADKKNEKLAATGKMTKDPICGSYVTSNCDIRVKKDGESICFCSYECRDKYLRQLEADKEKVQ
jgi:YHS domain-containing protein